MHDHKPLVVIAASFRRFAILLLALAFFAAALQAQGTASTRRIVLKTTPSYPELARQMGIGGIVRIDAVVSSDGTVKTLSVKGGHPVLVQAATNTIRKWKWEPATRESHELIEIHFSPSE
jgi:TonB family protein